VYVCVCVYVCVHVTASIQEPATGDDTAHEAVDNAAVNYSTHTGRVSAILNGRPFTQ